MVRRGFGVGVTAVTLAALMVVSVSAAPAQAVVVTCGSAPANFAELAAPADLRAGRTESDVCVSTSGERQAVTLTTALLVDDVIGDPGTWLPAGSVVSSRIFHVDKEGTGTPGVAFTAQYVMPEPVLAVVTSQTRLVGSDTRLGVTGARYATSGRGLEAGESVTVEPDGVTVSLALSSASDVDNVRIITGTPGPRAATATALAVSNQFPTLGQSVTLTASLTAIGGAVAPTGRIEFRDAGALLASRALSGTRASFSTTGLTAGPHELTAEYVGDARWAPSQSAPPVAVTVRVPPVCNGEPPVPITDPYDLRQARWESDSCLFVLEESTVTLTAPLTLDRPATPGGPTEIVAGTTVTSTLVHIDKLGNTTTPRNIAGTLTTGQAVAGLLTRSASLSATDALLGRPGTVYPTAANRGLEADDLVTVAGDGRSVDLAAVAGTGVDHLRVVTVNTPPSCETDPLVIDEDVATTITLPCADLDGDSFSATVDSSTALTASLSGDQLTLLSDPNYAGPGAVTLLLDDGADTALVTLAVEVQPVNDGPTCTAPAVRVGRGGSTTFTVTCSDPEGDEVTLGLTDAPNHGTATVDGLDVTYDHGAGPAISDSLTIEASDGEIAVPLVVGVQVVTPLGLVTNAQLQPAANPSARYSAFAAVARPEGVRVLGVRYPVVGAGYGLVRAELDDELRSDIEIGDRGIADVALPPNLYPAATKLDTDGTILVLGGDGTILRYNQDGTSTSAFGGDGRTNAATVPAPFFFANFFDAVTQPDGKVVAVAYGWQNNDYNNNWSFFFRFNTDGTVDTTFGTNGVAMLAPTWPSPYCWSSNPYYRVRMRALTLQPDGKIVAAGEHFWCGGDRITVARLNTDGTFDTGFGTGGQTLDLSGQQYGYSVAVWLEGDKIVVGGGGWTLQGGGIVQRFNADGTLDASYGTNGRAVVGLGQIQTVRAAVPDGHGGVLFAGNVLSSQPISPVAVVRADADGELDAAFGTGGVATATVGQGLAAPMGILVLDTDTFAVVGVASSTGNYGNGDLMSYSRFDLSSGTMR